MYGNKQFEIPPTVCARLKGFASLGPYSDENASNLTELSTMTQLESLVLFLKNSHAIPYQLPPQLQYLAINCKDSFSFLHWYKPLQFHPNLTACWIEGYQDCNVSYNLSESWGKVNEWSKMEALSIDLPQVSLEYIFSNTAACMPNLKYISIKGKDDAMEIPASIVNNKNLQKIEIITNNLNLTKKSIRYLRRLPHLSHLIIITKDANPHPIPKSLYRHSPAVDMSVSLGGENDIHTPHNHNVLRNLTKKVGNISPREIFHTYYLDSNIFE